MFIYFDVVDFVFIFNVFSGDFGIDDGMLCFVYMFDVSGFD